MSYYNLAILRKELSSIIDIQAPSLDNAPQTIDALLDERIRVVSKYKVFSQLNQFRLRIIAGNPESKIIGVDQLFIDHLQKHFFESDVQETLSRAIKNSLII